MARKTAANLWTSTDHARDYLGRARFHLPPHPGWIAIYTCRRRCARRIRFAWSIPLAPRACLTMVFGASTGPTVPRRSVCAY